MHSRLFQVSRHTLLVFVALGFAGCSLLPMPKKDPTRFYVLTGPTANELNTGHKKGQIKVGVRSVTVAPYLDGKTMIVRRGPNEIDYRDYARWAEPLATGINRMLVARLHLSDRVQRVIPQPFPFDTTRDVDVQVSVLRCEGMVKKDGKSFVSFMCGIELVRAGEQAGSGEVLLREVYEAPETPWREGDYAELARRLSEEVARVADRVLAALPSE
jgi:uncharacterized lipoprotein YmbA